MRTSTSCVSSVDAVACAGDGSSPSQTDAPSNTHGRCNTAVQSQLDSSQIEPELRAVLPVAALQQHLPRAPVTDHPLSLHGHACAGDGSSPSQTEAPIDATRVAMKPVLYSSAHEHASARDCRDRLMHRVMPRSLQWHQILLRLSQSCGQCYL